MTDEARIQSSITDAVLRVAAANPEISDEQFREMVRALLRERIAEQEKALGRDAGST